GQRPGTRTVGAQERARDDPEGPWPVRSSVKVHQFERARAMNARTWTDLLAKERLEVELGDFKTALGDHEAHVEASRCINCYDAPCIQACPTGIDIPRF